MAYYRLEPWGEFQDDRRAALVASTIANVNRKKGSPPHKIQDFMPQFEKQGQDWREQKRLMQMAIGK